MEDIIEFGKVYFIKNGEIIEKTLHTNQNELEKMASTIVPSTITQITALEESNDQEYDCNLQTKALESYIEFLKNGYSIIRVAYNFSFGINCENGAISVKQFNQESFTIIPEKIDEKSYQLILNTFRNANKNISDHCQYIYNIIQQGSNFDYDYLEFDRSKDEKLDVFLREKLNMLTLEEQEMMTQYRNYNLEAILTTDYRAKKINHKNAGVIVVTPNKTYEKTTIKEHHGTEIEWCLKNSKLINKNYDNRLWILSEKTNSIIIQLCKDKVILWLNSPEKMTQYQISELKRIIDSINQVIEKGNNLEISTAICENSLFRSIDNYEIIKLNFEENRKRA